MNRQRFTVYSAVYNYLRGLAIYLLSCTTFEYNSVGSLTSLQTISSAPPLSDSVRVDSSQTVKGINNGIQQLRTSVALLLGLHRRSCEKSRRCVRASGRIWVKADAGGGWASWTGLQLSFVRRFQIFASVLVSEANKQAEGRAIDTTVVVWVR